MIYDENDDMFSSNQTAFPNDIAPENYRSESHHQQYYAKPYIMKSIVVHEGEENCPCSEDENETDFDNLGETQRIPFGDIRDTPAHLYGCDLEIVIETEHEIGS